MSVGEFWPECIGIINGKDTYSEENTFRWILPNCFAHSYKKSNNETASCVICSPSFTYFQDTWRLALIRNGYQKENIGFFLWKDPDSKTFWNNYKHYYNTEKITVKLSLKNYDAFDEYVDSACSSTGCFGNWNFLHVSKLIEEKSELSPAGLLEFSCTFKIGEKLEAKPNQAIYQAPSIKSKAEEEEESTSRDDKSKEIPEAEGVDKLLLDFKNLLLNGQNSDLVLMVQGREFKVHRNILIVRSPVFASMLQHDTKENKTGVVDIPDCTPGAFDVFLSYVYTGNADDMSSDNVFDLYYAADKYQINDLKTQCLEYMVENLSIENFCAVMSLSLKHCESDLQEKAVRFFCKNYKAIIKTASWIKYVTEYPVQANELFIKMSNA